ncbi:hypothetical protein FIBSPDRAFT_1047033 [Athelia psychrophila]|uniref:Secreted protein n=1 Tax=Athelia psychrophila TaxID=1759441 RepID=A0A166FQR6_9AGAM|nr:hypothetical protein FIBSPDRAFT_1047033 [Fibularhizoctonia sp. CBS 109695]
MSKTSRCSSRLSALSAHSLALLITRVCLFSCVSAPRTYLTRPGSSPSRCSSSMSKSPCACPSLLLNHQLPAYTRDTILINVCRSRTLSCVSLSMVCRWGSIGEKGQMSVLMYGVCKCKRRDVRNDRRWDVPRS